MRPDALRLSLGGFVYIPAAYAKARWQEAPAAAK